MKAVRSLYSFYKRFKKVLTYYRGCHIMTIFAEHGHRPAAQQMGALAIDWRKAGFEVITMILEVKHAPKLDYESVASFDDLLNRAADALPVRNFVSSGDRILTFCALVEKRNPDDHGRGLLQ